MTLKEHLHKLNQDVEATFADLHELKELSDEDAKAIVDTMQAIEDRFSNLLAQFGVELGDERVD